MRHQFENIMSESCAGFDGLYSGDPTPWSTAVVRGVVKELVCYEKLVLAEAGAVRK